MHRVLIEDDATEVATGAEIANGYRADSYDSAHDDLRNARSKRDNRQHKPRRNSSAASRHRAIGPYSRLPAIVELDGRRKEAMLMVRVREELTQHIGGDPNAVERLLIERAVVLCLRCCQIDTRIMAGEILTAHDNAYAISWNNALRRCLVDLGLQPRQPVTNGNDLGDWVQSRSKARVP
jgi:hypothetical protein